jgi:L-alanine-DL-glutamate epimerase-like enolase superfamily enzyme
VSIEQGSQIKAYGECCPRGYVSGENYQTVLAFLKNSEMKNFWKLQSLDDIVSFDSDNKNLIDKNTSGFCAAEMALLDLLGQQSMIPLEMLWGQERINCASVLSAVSRQNATLVFGLDSINYFYKNLFKYMIMGFRHFKIKILSDDIFLQTLFECLNSTLAQMNRKLGGTFRLDANNSFKETKDVLKMLEKFQGLIIGLEEPIPKGFKIHLQNILANSPGIPIIIDDSFILIEDLEPLFRYPQILIPNVRISKNGGLLRSLKMIKVFKNCGISYVIGSQVGETSLLTRAALALVTLSEHKPLFFEGGFSNHLLTVDPATPNLIIGLGARIENLSKVNKKNGLGLNLLTEEYKDLFNWENLFEVNYGS